MIQTGNWLLSRTAGLFVLLAATLAIFVPAFLGPTHHYFRTQDLPATIAILPIFLLALVWRPHIRLPDRMPSLVSVVMLGVLLALALWAGTHWLMLDYPLTRDEHMAVFDAQIFASGQLAQPLAPEWQEYAYALVPHFLLDVPGSGLLISAYMPGNSMMRAGFAAIADPALMNPILCAIGFVALYDIARRLFSETPAAVWVALATYLLSVQVLVNAMTSYAMTGHLSLNLVWLALFLRGRWWQHALAMAIGAWTIGLHQVVFHPLFAGPFILILLRQGRWGLFVAYATVYAAALLFWISYPSIVVSSFDIPAAPGSAGGITGFFYERVWPLLSRNSLAGIGLMEFNVLRLMVWSPLFLLPLVALAWSDIRRFDSVALPLFGGVALTFVAMIVLLPYQGHGWGYRYLHGLLGNLALLASFGYLHWVKDQRERADGTVALLGGATAFILLPFLSWSAYSFTAPYARLSAAIERQDSDFVILDTETSFAAIDQVRNRADLTNRPLVFSSTNLNDAQLADLCERGSVVWVGASEIASAELPMPAVEPRKATSLNAGLLNDCAHALDWGRR